MKRERERGHLHCCCAFTLFYINITETTGIWWPSHNAKRLLWVGYGSVILRLVCLFYVPSPGQFVADFYGIPLSYVPPGKHLPAVLTMDAFDCFEYTNFMFAPVGSLVPHADSISWLRGRCGLRYKRR